LLWLLLLVVYIILSICIVSNVAYIIYLRIAL
jgi:hypothetical protein